MEATMSDRLTVAVNLLNKAPSQYFGVAFNSVVEFNGKLVYFGDSGVFEEGGDTDDGVAISAWFNTPLHDFGRREQKGIEAYGLGYESDGELTFTLYGAENDTHARAYTIEPVRAGQVQQDHMQTLKKYRYGKSRYWMVQVKNVEGSDFSVDNIELAVVVYKRRSIS
jgi:hypothetical protein